MVRTRRRQKFVLGRTAATVLGLSRGRRLKRTRGDRLEWWLRRELKTLCGLANVRTSRCNVDCRSMSTEKRVYQFSSQEARSASQLASADGSFSKNRNVHV